MDDQLRNGSLREPVPSAETKSAFSVFLKRNGILLLFACLVALFVAFLPLFSQRINAVDTAKTVRYTESAETEDITATEDTTAADGSPVLKENIPAETASPAHADGSASAESGHSGGSMHISNYTLLKLNDSYPAVETLHERLIELGYLESDEPTTVFSESTAAAVSLFQRTMNIAQTGIADSELQECLFSADAVSYETKNGDTGADIKSMQARLKELGYYTGKVNGCFGTATEEALRAFQKKNRLDVDGVFGSDDRDLLFSLDAKPAIDPTPTPRPTPKPTKKPVTTKKPETTKKPTSTTKPKATATPKPTKEPKATASPTPAAPGDNPAVTAVPADDGTVKTTPTPAPTKEPEPTATPADGKKSYGSGINGMIACAEDQLGKKYVLGDEGPNTFDCSGLVYYCLKNAGVKTSRCNARSFAKNEKWTLISDMGDLKRGDLLFFKDDKKDYVTHTGIYIGGGTMIDASSSNGKVVKRSCTTSYWKRNFVCGRRVF